MRGKALYAFSLFLSLVVSAAVNNAPEVIESVATEQGILKPNIATRLEGQ